ncbi:MAG: HAD family hydrolase [Clostridia bacterium]|nr:HAD family hydrolase [Clostridia bacterium]
MKITTVLFDLDGTLLPMDMNEFIKAYFGGLAHRLAHHGYDPQKLIDAIWQGTAAMVKNNGEVNNEERFWQGFEATYGQPARQDEELFAAFYREDFDKVSSSCGYTPAAREVIDTVKACGLRVALATNPIFPAMATERRIAWAGLSTSDFELYTTYENSRFCKPNPDYYRDVMNALGVSPEECLMVGNDVVEDMVAQTLGSRVFLLTDNLINPKNVDISAYPHGSWDELLAYIKGL